MQDIRSEEFWFALRVRSRHEQSVAYFLTAKGYEELLPTYRARHRWADRWKQVELPLFPGYVFCKFNPAVPLPILTTPGIVEVVRRGREFAPVPETEISALKLVLRSRLPAEPSPCFETGQHVHIDCGPLAGLTGIVVEMKSRWRLVLTVTLLQRSVSVEIEREWATPYRTPGCICTDACQPEHISQQASHLQSATSAFG